MKLGRKIIFYTFLVSTLAIIAFAFWFFSGQPNEKQIAEAFPLNSYDTFNNGKKLTLYSIEPFKTIDDAEKFQGYSVIGRTEIKNGNFQKLLKHAFLNDSANTNGDAACFNPRHGLRISDGKETVDLLICYECGNFVTFTSNKKGKGKLNGTSEILLNKTLTDAGIKILEK